MANDTLTFTEGDKEITLVMYSGITNKLMNCADLTRFENMVINPEVQDQWVDIMLTEYDDSGKKKGYVFPPFKLSNSNRGKLIAWGLEHVADFLLEILGEVKKLDKKVTESSSAIVTG